MEDECYHILNVDSHVPAGNDTGADSFFALVIRIFLYPTNQ